MTRIEFLRIRKLLGLTQVELAEAMSRSVGQISHWERGVYPVDGLAAEYMKLRLFSHKHSRFLKCGPSAHRQGVFSDPHHSQ